jgi:hypothetical protein
MKTPYESIGVRDNHLMDRCGMTCAGSRNAQHQNVLRVTSQRATCGQSGRFTSTISALGVSLGIYDFSSLNGYEAGVHHYLEYLIYFRLFDGRLEMCLNCAAHGLLCLRLCDLGFLEFFNECFRSLGRNRAGEEKTGITTELVIDRALLLKREQDH